MSIAAFNRTRNAVLLCLLVGLAAAGVVRADDGDELQELVGPVALYPDDLLAIVLPASTYPLQIVEAARFLERRKTDPDLQPDDDWDDAVVALLNYPEVVAQLNDDLDWTWALGEAFIENRAGTMDAVQRFRERARLAGNLNTDDHQVVHEVEGAIEIEPVDQEVIYVPYYEPSRVVVRHYRPVYYYYPRPYPVYYYPYHYGYSFADDVFWGVTTYFAFNWISHSLHAHHYHHYAHPYRGRAYHRRYYTRHHFNRHYGGRYKYRYNDVWRPARRHGARPRHAIGKRRHVNVRRDGRRFAAPRHRDQRRIVNNRDQRRNFTNRRDRRDNFANNGGQRRSSFAPRRDDRGQRAAPRRQRGGEDARTRVAQNRPSARDIQRRRDAMANTSRRAPSRQQPRMTPNRSGGSAFAPSRSAPRRAAPNRAAPQRAAPRRAAPARSAPPRAAPARSAPRRAAPARSAPRRAARASGERQARSNGSRSGARSGGRLR